MAGEELFMYLFVESTYTVSKVRLFCLKLRNYLFRFFITNYAYAANCMYSNMRLKK